MFRLTSTEPAAGEREDKQRALVAAMMEPSFYPKPPAEVTHLETHISHLFFAGEVVYKVKKPVRFSFLDYSTLGRRRYFLHEELRLNRRLAPSVYLMVVPISFDGEAWRLGGDLRPTECALVMRRLPARRMLDFLLDHDQVTPEMMRALAEILAHFHASAPTSERIGSRGDPEAIRRVWEENLADIGDFIGKVVDSDTVDAIRVYGERFLLDHRALFLDRVRRDRIREGHGDLHCAHVCFAPEGVQIFDCIDFSLGLRCCDVASEMAFLAMDIEFRGRSDLARDLLGRYEELSGDREMNRLLPFYKCYRALVRAKVAALRSAASYDESRRYFDLAYSFTWEEHKPFLVIICGLTGSGKSTLARDLSRRLGLKAISSDVTRKRLAGISGDRDAAPFEQGIYSPVMTQRTYAAMAEEAETLLRSGEGAILDATFHRREHRQRFFDLAGRYGVPFAVVSLEPPDEIARRRLERRGVEGSDISDGRWEIYLEQTKRLEPLTDVSPRLRLVVDTTSPPEVLVRGVEGFLRSAVSRGEP